MSLLRLLDPGDWLSMKPQIDPAAAPLEFRYQPSRDEVRFRFIVGFSVLAVVAVAAYFLRDDGVALLVIGGFAVAALLNIVYGVLQSRFSFSLLITGLEVKVEKRTIRGPSCWSETLHSYQGVLFREEDVEDSGSSRIRSMSRYSIVELYHSNPGKTIPLFVREGGEAPREIQQQFARRFHLPELEEDIDGVAAPGRLRRASDPGPPPPGVVVQETGGVTYFGLDPGRSFRWVPWVTWPLLPATMAAVAHQVLPEMTLIVAGIASAFVLFMLLLGAWAGRGPKRLPWGFCLCKDTLWLGVPDQPPSRTARFDQVRRVRLERVRGLFSGSAQRWFRIVIDAHQCRFELSGRKRQRDPLDWIRKRILFALSKGALSG